MLDFNEHDLAAAENGGFNDDEHSPSPPPSAPATGAALRSMGRYRGGGGKGTHNGMDDTCGVFTVPDYATDADVRERYFTDIIEDLHRRGAPYALMENIGYLPEDALTRLRFDIDAALPFDGDHPLALNRAVAHNFCAVLWRVLRADTNIRGSSRFFIDLKGAPTPVGDAKWKHGMEITCADIKCTHGAMRGVRQLMYQRFAAWGRPEWLPAGTEIGATQIIDDCIYKSNGTMLHGATKKAQRQHGGYETVAVMAGDDLSCFSDGDLADLSFSDRLRLKSILHHDEATVAMAWKEGMEPIMADERAAKRRRTSTARTMLADAENHFTNKLTTADVQRIYSEAGGVGQLQQIAGARAGSITWRERSPGNDSRACLVPECNGTGHSDNALLIECIRGLAYLCCSTNKRTFLKEWESDEDLLFGGDLGLAKLYARLRAHDVKNTAGDNTQAKFYVFDETTALWKERHNSFVREREIPKLIEVYIAPELAKLERELKALRAEAAAIDRLCARRKRGPTSAEKKVLESLEAAEERSQQLQSLKGYIQRSGSREGILKDIFSSVRDMEFAELLDADKDLYSCRNGVIDLRTATLRARTRADMQTQMVNLNYDPNSPRIPEAMQILTDITLAERLGRPDLLERLLRLMGYSITGHSSEDIIIFLMGKLGRNGKGIVETVMMEVVGHMFYQAPQTFLTACKPVSAGAASPHAHDGAAEGAHLLRRRDPCQHPAGRAAELNGVNNDSSIVEFETDC